jgi:hypothetical protein
MQGIQLKAFLALFGLSSYAIDEGNDIGLYNSIKRPVLALF